LAIPAGTVITVRTSQFLSSDQNHVGDTFNAVLDQPIIVDGWVVARRGQTVVGRVTVAQKATRVSKENSQLGVELTELTLVDGQQLPLRTQLLQATGRGVPAGQEVGTVGATTVTGAAIGAIAGRGEGAGIGAAAGAAAGIIGVLLTPGRPTVMPPETLLTFRQEYPLTVSTTRSAQAFQPVSQQDYGRNNTLQYRPQNMVAGPGYPPPVAAPYWDYYAAYPGYYPWGFYPYYPAFGFYYGFGPRVFVGPRFGGAVVRGFRR
jgi:hypothetical protein